MVARWSPKPEMRVQFPLPALHFAANSAGQKAGMPMWSGRPARETGARGVDRLSSRHGYHMGSAIEVVGVTPA